MVFLIVGAIFSAAVSSGSGGFADGGENVFWVPVVGGIPRDDFAVLADEDGRKGVGDRFAVAGSDADVEELCNRGEIFFCGGGEVPVEELFVGVVAGVGAAVAAEDFGGVVGGVEADAEEMGL